MGQSYPSSEPHAVPSKNRPRAARFFRLRPQRSRADRSIVYVSGTVQPRADKRVRSAQARERSEKDRGVAMTNYSLASTSCLVLSCLVLSCLVLWRMCVWTVCACECVEGVWLTRSRFVRPVVRGGRGRRARSGRSSCSARTGNRSQPSAQLHTHDRRGTRNAISTAGSAAAVADLADRRTQLSSATRSKQSRLIYRSSSSSGGGSSSKRDKDGKSSRAPSCERRSEADDAMIGLAVSSDSASWQSKRMSSTRATCRFLAVPVTHAPQPSAVSTQRWLT
eukprot:COSAG06_NODE_180_length_20940_cov_7.005758_16_plen_279_part_00